MAPRCIDCIHCVLPSTTLPLLHRDYRAAVCAHPRSAYPDLVSGDAVTPLCDSARISPCGARGELFEARETVEVAA